MGKGRPPFLGAGVVRFRSEFKQLARQMDAEGWTMSSSARGHAKFVSPTGAIVIHSGSSGDWRGTKNLLPAVGRDGVLPALGSWLGVAEDWSRGRVRFPVQGD